MTCIECGQTDYMTDASCGCCDKDVDGDAGLCDECSCDVKTKKCSKCKESFCASHGKFVRWQCCGAYLCDSPYADDGCVCEHQVHKLPCGHDGCNYASSKVNCRQCVAGANP